MHHSLSEFPILQNQSGLLFQAELDNALFPLLQSLQLSRELLQHFLHAVTKGSWDAFSQHYDAAGPKMFTNGCVNQIKMQKATAC